MATLLETLKQTVISALAAADAGFVPDVTAITKGAEAEAARTARARATTVWSVAEDPEVKLARATHAELAALLAKAEAKRQKLESSTGTLTTENPKLDKARELVMDIQAALTVADGWVMVAAQATIAWIHQQRREELKAIDAVYAEQLEAVLALARQHQTYADATTHLAGTRDPEDPGHPFPVLLVHGEAIERARTWWAPRPEPPREPMVKVLHHFSDRDNGGTRRHPDDLVRVASLSDATLDDLLRRGLVEHV